MTLQAIGYWFDDRAPNAYPRVQRLIGPGAWKGRARAKVVAYLRHGALFESYRASSFCRFACGARAKDMGHRDLFDGRFVWPEGLAHYVEQHAVRLPDHFIAHALASPAPDVTRPAAREGLIDDARWIAWGRAQHAAIDLTGWQRPDHATVEAVTARLAAVVTRGHVLWRQRVEILLVRPNAIVVGFRDDRLAIVMLARTGPATPPPTIMLAGWDAWPSPDFK